MTTNTGEWLYSTEALNVLDKFHNSNYIIFVEGDEDVAFWDAIFEKANVKDYYIESAGGIEELKKIMAQILTEDARVIVACDSEYSMLLNNKPEHKQIITTYGNSIENTMYCPKTINAIINKLSHKIEDREDLISEWIEYFCKASKVLVVYDIAREKYTKPIVVCGNNCSRFLSSDRSSRLNETAISEFISSINPHFTKPEVEECQRILAESEYGLRHIIRGHFLTNGVVNLIKGFTKRILGKSPVIPLDMLYALTCDGCKQCNNECPEYLIVEQRIKDAVSSLLMI